MKTHYLIVSIIFLVILIAIGCIGYYYANKEPEIAIKDVTVSIPTTFKVSQKILKANLSDIEPPTLTLKGQTMVNLYENPNKSTNTPNSGIIYLTFDDGPSTDITPKVLNILAEENVKATFFILNYNTATEKLVKREAQEGHNIGIHGYSHDYKAIYQSVETYMKNVTTLQNKIKKTTGITTYITRFPGGSSNTVSSFNPKIMTKLTKEVVKRGFKYYDWNVSSGDAGGAKNRNQVYRNVTKNLMKDRSNVVLMHDFSGNNKTLDALRAIIQFGKKNGYTFKPITQDTPMITHAVNN